MNKMILLVLPLILASLACLKTAITPTPVGASAVPAASYEQEPDSGAVFELTEVPPVPEPRCAVVSAIVAVNLRADPSPRAAIKTALLNGETVTIHKLIAGWYSVSTRAGQGYVNAAYLTESECR